MQITGTKIKTDWEKLKDIKIEETKLKSKLATTKFTKDNNLILKPQRQFQPQPIFGLDSSFMYSQYQKQLFDNLGIDQNVISEFNKFWHTIIKEYGPSLDAYVRFSQIQSDMLTDAVEMFANLIYQGIDWYSRIYQISLQKSRKNVFS